MKKRINFIVSCILILFILLSANIFRCMFFYDDSLENLAEQYYKQVELIYPRGDITDCSGISFTHRSSDIFPYIRLSDDTYPSVAKQIIGKTEVSLYDTTSDGMKGVNGINLIYDELLSGGSAMSVYCMADAGGNLLTGPVALVGSDHLNEGCDVMLTLDYVLQKETEEIIKRFSEETGHDKIALTLTDCETGEILVMATYGSEMNMNVLSYQPGSVMKIISAAAALESGIISPEEIFVCHGEFSVGDDVRHCSSKAVHGKMTMKEAFAISCNEWAYNINKKLSEENNGKIINKALELAKEWGFCEYGNEYHEFILDYDGFYSFVPEELYNDMDIFNSALGQGNIQASVYLINKITSAIANGGNINKPHIVKSITDPAGNIIFSADENYEIFSLSLKKQTVDDLQAFLRQTCMTGSASGISIKDAAGKTGTAENISSMECHSWFTGYFPAGEKNYAMTVFVENGGNAPRSAVPLWESIAEMVVKMYVSG